MNLTGQRILLTGAGGGIGSELARCLATRGARLLLVDRDPARLEQQHSELQAQGAEVSVFACDFGLPGASQSLAEQVLTQCHGVDVLINCAGLASFGEFSQLDPVAMETLWRVNVLAPMQLTQALLPQMVARGSGRIVNVGSIFGSIAFAYFAAYSASKFAMRGFSEALRRELADSGVSVTYVAPRYTQTPFNTGPVARMAATVGMNSDTPAVVARHVARALERDAKDVYIGWPECLFVRINALLPRLVDAALRKQNAVTKPFAQNSN